mgnify:CR=1 FL=1
MISLVSIRDCKRKKEKVRMKKKALLTIGIIFSMVITSFNMNFENVDADGTEASEQYIVSTKNGELFKDIQTKYGDCISDEAEKAESLEEHNTTVLELPEKEAQQLEKKQGITIEPDCEMEGLGETEDNLTDVSEWNMQMINADENTEKSKDKIKVAIIDSGVDYTNGIKVAERYNLVPGEEDINIIYEDRTGHGTAVAAIIAANSKDKDGISGIAPDNVELYSVKALDCENKAPLSRIVDGIYWAVDKGVNIINLSLGTKTNADILEQAIKYADSKGVLIIAAAGNDKQIQYPAAYDEVIAVGSVSKDGNISKNSADDERVELAAPGEAVKSACFLDGTLQVSGTSVAAPHVTGVAAVLWAKDKSKSKEFIRDLLKETSKKLEDGSGLIDLQYAQNKYDEFSKNYQEGIDNSDIIEKNPEKVENFSETDNAEALWGDAVHTSVSSSSGLTGVELKLLYGALIYSDHDEDKSNTTDTLGDDAGISRMTYNWTFHGYGYGQHHTFDSSRKLLHKHSTKIRSNYIANTMQIYKLAMNYKNGIYTRPDKVAGIYDSDYEVIMDRLNADSKNGIVKTMRPSGAEDEYGNIIGKTITPKTVSWDKIFHYCVRQYQGSTSIIISNNNKNRSVVILGLALHNAMDTFSHSSCRSDGTLIKHDKNTSTGKKLADDASYYPNRVDGAVKVAKSILQKYQNEKALSASDFNFNAVYKPYQGAFTLIGYAEYMNSVNSNYYNSHKADIDQLSTAIK